MAGESDDAAVMISVTGAMENQRAFDFRDSLFQGRDFLEIAPFREIRNALE
jgi:hypothetical protein